MTTDCGTPASRPLLISSWCSARDATCTLSFPVKRSNWEESQSALQSDGIVFTVKLRASFFTVCSTSNALVTHQSTQHDQFVKRMKQSCCGPCNVRQWCWRRLYLYRVCNLTRVTLSGGGRDWGGHVAWCWRDTGVGMSPGSGGRHTALSTTRAEVSSSSTPLCDMLARAAGVGWPS